MIRKNSIESEVNNLSVDIDELVRSLQDPRWEVRRDAAKKLSEVRCAKVTINLAAAIEDSMPEVRQAAIGAIKKIGAEAGEAVPALIKALRDHHVDYLAAEALGAMGSAAKEAIPALTRHLLEDPSFRSYNFSKVTAVMRALGSIERDAGLIPKLVALVRIHSHEWGRGDYQTDRNNVSLCRQAIHLLGDIGHPAIPALIGILRGHLPRQVLPSIRQWGTWGSEDKEIAMSAAYVLGGLKADKAVPIFVDMLRAKHFAFWDDWHPPVDDVRIEAAKLLGVIGSSARKAAPVLTRMLDDYSPSVREAAATALESIIGTSRTIEQS